MRMNDILDRTPKGEKLTANNGHEIYTKIHAKVRTGERDHLGEQRNGTARLRQGALQRGFPVNEEREEAQGQR